MNLVKFPGLGLEFNISQIAFKIGSVSIYKYAILIALGIIIGVVLAKFSKYNFGIDFETVLEVLIFGMIFGIIGARVYYILFKFNYYLKNPLQILNIRDGGLAIYGGIIGIILFLVIYCKIKKINFLNLTDYLIPYLSLGQSIGRWGNFFNVEAYGSATKSILRMGIESSAGYIEVHPVFLYESIFTFIIFLILLILRRNRKFEGQVFYMYFILYGFVRMILEGIRADSLKLGNIRISQGLSFVLFLVFLIVYEIKRKEYSKKEK